MTVADSVIAKLAGRAALATYGVVDLRRSRLTPFLRLFRDELMRGVEVDAHESYADIGLHVVIERGLNLAEVTRTSSSRCASRSSGWGGEGRRVARPRRPRQHMSARGHVLEVLKGASAALGIERGYINDLNVYPVPDGDTGTNLFLTVQAVIDEVDGSPADDLAQPHAVVIRGSLMGARGNSGVILSQIVRGACESIAAAQSFNAGAVRDALGEATNAAYRAVRQPVEGTMLSVMRAMSEAAAGAPQGSSLPELLTTVTTAGAETVERTIDQLEALRRAGVVDAGGYGLLVLLRGGVAGFLQGRAGSAAAAAVTADGSDRRRGRASRATSRASRPTPSRNRSIATAQASFGRRRPRPRRPRNGS